MFLFSRRKRIIKKAVDNTVKALGSRTPKIFEHFFLRKRKKGLFKLCFFVFFSIYIASANPRDGTVLRLVLFSNL